MASTSILDDVKKVCGIESSDTAFDTDVIMHINTAFFTLFQLGVGPTTCFSIENNTPKWSDFLGTSSDLNAAKSCIALKVRLMFDPPASSTVLESISKTILDLESRLMMQADATLHPYTPPVVLEEEDVFE